MQPKLADCFVVPKSLTVFVTILVFKIFYHAVVIMRIDCDCMFEEIILAVQVFLQIFLTNSINFLFYFIFLAPFEFFHSEIN